MQIDGFRPLIVAFCCNWCSYAGADLAGSNRLSYPADVRIIKVPCSCRVNPIFVLKAFERGADGVIICGCHRGLSLHYGELLYPKKNDASVFDARLSRNRKTENESGVDFGCGRG